MRTDDLAHMRCLYCGKGLAFLKRLTGGEFCSDAHRQRYQEEYNQLALNRLLQAKPLVAADTLGKVQVPEGNPPSDVKTAADPKPAEFKRVEETPLPLRQAHVERVRPESIHHEPAATAATQALAPEPVREPEPVVTQAEPEPLAPARQAGFLIEFPVPAKTAALPAPTVAGDFQLSARPALPQRQVSLEQSTAPLAEKVELPSFHRVMDCAARPRERRLDVRVFVRTTPIVEVGLRPASETRLEPAPNEPLEMVYPPPSPPAPANQWQETPREFAAFALELGEWTRLDFQTTGLPEVSETAQPLAPPASMVIVETGALVAPKPPEASVSALPDQPPVQLPGSNLQPLPEVVTRPAPLILHGLPAGRAKPAHVFPSALSSGAAVLTPRSDALPLRPVMILGQAPAVSEERSSGRRTSVEGTAAKAERPKQQPATVPRAADVKVLAPKAAPVRREVTTPAPPAAPHSEPDLGLPILNLAAPENFWRRMPAGVKASLAAAVLVLAGGVILFTANSAGGRTAPPYRLEIGAPLRAGEGSWIDDFAPDLSRVRQRQVSVLRESIPLSDYRLEFQGQIENKAIGWVFRAKDAGNFYAMKLEMKKPEPDGAADLISFAVINGEEQPRRQTSLPMAVHPYTVFKVRVEAVGDHFTTWIQDQKVDEWTDSQIRAGGAGLYNERGERGSLKSALSVTPLIRKK